MWSREELRGVSQVLEVEEALVEHLVFRLRCQVQEQQPTVLLSETLNQLVSRERQRHLGDLKYH